MHGATYFDRLVDEVEALQAGDHVFFTDWRGDPDERMRPDGPTVAELLRNGRAARCRRQGLMWRSHLDMFRYSEEENRHLGEAIEAAGGEVLLDQRVRRGGSHHQKLVVLRHPRPPGARRRVRRRHRPVPQPPRRRRARGRPAGGADVAAYGDPRRGTTCSSSCAARWSARWTPSSGSAGTIRPGWTAQPDRLSARPARSRRPERRPAAAAAADPPPCGPHDRAGAAHYPAIRPRTASRPAASARVARGYTKAIRRARRLIYLEDQYLWSTEVAMLFAEALRANPELHLVAVVPRYPDVDGRAGAAAELVGREQAIDALRAGGGDRVHVFDVENHAGTPVYVHAKVCVVDDVWASVGSDNFNRRSGRTTASCPMGCSMRRATSANHAIPAGLGDGARVFARDLRLPLWREHLDRAEDGTEDGDLLDPAEAVAAFERTAHALNGWYAGGRVGPRPPGRLRPHQPERLPWLTRCGPCLLIAGSRIPRTPWRSGSVAPGDRRVLASPGPMTMAMSCNRQSRSSTCFVSSSTRDGISPSSTRGTTYTSPVSTPLFAQPHL